MNARELHDKWKASVESDICPPVDKADDPLILLALDLLASVEESEDETVQKLHKSADMWDSEARFVSRGGAPARVDGQRLAGVFRNAAAAIVLLQAENFDRLDRLRRIGHERDEAIKESAEMAGELAELNDRLIPKISKERDKLKAHAEEMHNKARRIVNGHDQIAAVEALEKALDAYRRDFPND